MWTPSLALLGQAMRVDSRRLSGHVFRAIFAVIMLFALSFAHFFSFAFGAPGLWLFKTLAWQDFVFITLAGIGYFSTVISEEKDDETLGLLRMAGIGPLVLLLGKSTARLIIASLVLAVQIPFTLLATTLGGVTTYQIAAAYFCLTAWLVLVASIGLFCSMAATGSARATAWTTVLVLLFFFVPYLAQAVANAPVFANAPQGGPLQSIQSACDAAVACLPTDSLSRTLSTGFSGPLISAQVVCNLVAAVLLFLVTWGSFERLTRPRTRSGIFDGTRLQVLVRPAGGKSRRCWDDAMIWQGYHFVAFGHRMLIARFAGLGVLAACIAWFNRSDLETAGATIMLTMFIVGMIEAATFSSRLFSSEMQQQVLPTLMMLPLSTFEIGYFKVMGASLGLIPYVAIFLIGGMIAPGSFATYVWQALSEPFVWIWFLEFIILLHTTTLMSLFVKWGALPLSLAILYFGQTCVFPIFMLPMLAATWTDSTLLAYLPLILISVGLMVCLQVFIHRRLQVLATR